jgi:hypothetical protein
MIGRRAIALENSIGVTVSGMIAGCKGNDYLFLVSIPTGGNQNER